MKSMNHKHPLHIIAFVCMIMLELSLTSLIRFAPYLMCTATSAPYARFTFIPVNPYVNDTVSFDASTSKPDGGDIVSYEWNFGDGTNGTGMYATKFYTEPGNFTVELTVKDSEGGQDTTWKLITVLPQPNGASIDLYNQKGGQGRNEPDGTFNLGEMVILTALILYNNEPVQNKPVGFEVSDPNGDIVLIRSNFTDKNGLATINFTLPDFCLPNIFGTWIAVTTASVSEQIVSDTLTFKVKGPFIDVYTQKEPYSGKGPRQPSDAFAPQEEVLLYAYVSCSCEPQQNKPVCFEVIAPNGTVIVDRTAFTNSVGIASTSFRIPWPCQNPEETVFGTWTVLAQVSVIEQTVKDTLTFQVGWIIQITEVKTLNATRAPKTIFARGEHVCFNLTVKNIAFTSKTATFTIAIFDERDVPIGQTILHGWDIPPGATRIFVIDLQIPKWAYIGVATVYANAYTDMPQFGGTPYCPEICAMIIIQTS